MPEIGGHRGKFLLIRKTENGPLIPTLEFSIPPLESVECALKRNGASFEEFTVNNADTEMVGDQIFIPDPPVNVAPGWHRDSKEPIIRITLDADGDSSGEFKITNGYPADIGPTGGIHSKYYVSRLNKPSTSGSIAVGYGLSLSWTNNTNNLAYLAAITGYKMPDRAALELYPNGPLLSAASHVFYYVVIATDNALDPEEKSSLTTWQDLELTINLTDPASGTLATLTAEEHTYMNLNPNVNRHFYWQPVNSSEHRGKKWVQNKFSANNWNKEIFKFHSVQGQPQTEILGHLLLCSNVAA